MFLKLVKFTWARWGLRSWAKRVAARSLGLVVFKFCVFVDGAYIEERAYLVIVAAL